eukprot:scaffold112068_cov49-Attheya_sp.AAC.1
MERPSRSTPHNGQWTMDNGMIGSRLTIEGSAASIYYDDIPTLYWSSSVVVGRTHLPYCISKRGARTRKVPFVADVQYEQRVRSTSTVHRSIIVPMIDRIIIHLFVNRAAARIDLRAIVARSS